MLLEIALISVQAGEPEFIKTSRDGAGYGGSCGSMELDLKIEQDGNNIRISFFVLATERAPCGFNGHATGKLSDQGTLEFRWEDSLKNSGTGTIRDLNAKDVRAWQGKRPHLSTDDIIVTMKTTHIENSRCLQCYGQDILMESGY